MSERDSTGGSRAEDFLALFKKGAEFTRELLQENERLRGQLMSISDRQQSAARNPADWDKLRSELVDRIASLEEECTSVRERLDQVELENSQFAQRYVEVEEENNNLANLYVSSYQLHSTLDLDEVVKIIMEIVINLIGAEVFAIYLIEGEDSQLTAVASEGREVSDFPTAILGEGALGKAAAAAESTCWDDARSDDLSQPIVCVPLVVQGRPIGAISVYSLLSQKDGFSALDHELFNMLGGHAATALFAAKLYSQSERKLNTIQGFIDLLTK
jgi:nitrate/nitrite-specific signal transduction histidine kinase